MTATEPAMRRMLFGLAVLAALTTVSPLLAATEGDYLSFAPGADQPISVTSKKFTARNVPGGKEAVFDGEVKVKQGELTLTCDKLAIIYDEERAKAYAEPSLRQGPKELQSVSGIKSIIASGNVKIVQNERMATAGKAEYDNLRRTITLTDGPPRLWQGPDVMMAHTVIIYLDENRSELRGGDGAVIKAVINPGKQKRDRP
jgi:lipopolysaccharide export system protein LptA